MRNLLLVSAAAASLLTGGTGMAQGRPGGGQGGGQGGGAPPAATGQSTGSYQQSCRNVQTQNGSITAECADAQGRYRSSTLAYGACRGDVSNNNGVLSCNGAAANAGAYVENGAQRNGGANAANRNDNNRNDNNRGNDRNDNRGNDVAAGVVAGAVIGGLLGGNAQVYAPGYSYPTYGDPHYGDPRFDPRYGPQGWGAGHRPGEFVSIRERANWLDREIDRAAQQGRFSRRDIRDFRNQLSNLEMLEDRYSRGGMQGWMRGDLDRRFDYLASRVRGNDGGSPPPPPPRDFGRDGGPPPGYGPPGGYNGYGR